MHKGVIGVAGSACTKVWLAQQDLHAQRCTSVAASLAIAPHGMPHLHLVLLLARLRGLPLLLLLLLLLLRLGLVRAPLTWGCRPATQGCCDAGLCEAWGARFMEDRGMLLFLLLLLIIIIMI